MSDLLSDLDLAPKRERVREPAREWRNWWRAPHAGVSVSRKTGRIIEVSEGEVFSSEGTHPSKEIAEMVALNRQREHPPQYKPLIYLGAFPEGERPHD